MMTDELKGADLFFNEAVRLGEEARRKYKHTGGLPGETHEVNTDYYEIEAFRCKGCGGLTQFAPVQLPAEGAIVVCEHCGDATRIIVWR